MFYIHKHEVGLVYAGPEEGGRWYEAGTPCGDWIPEGPFSTDEEAYDRCATLNEEERERAKKEETYEYTSVCAYLSDHYGYSVHETTIMEAYPTHRPHYE